MPDASDFYARLPVFEGFAKGVEQQTERVLQEADEPVAPRPRDNDARDEGDDSRPVHVAVDRGARWLVQGLHVDLPAAQSQE